MNWWVMITPILFAHVWGMTGNDWTMTDNDQVMPSH